MFECVGTRQADARAIIYSIHGSTAIKYSLIIVVLPGDDYDDYYYYDKFYCYFYGHFFLEEEKKKLTITSMYENIK